MLLEHNGWLDVDFLTLLNWVKDRFGRVLADDPRGGDATTYRGIDTTVDELIDAEEAARCPVEAKRLAMEWQRVLQRLVDHYEYHAIVKKNKKIKQLVP